MKHKTPSFVSWPRTAAAALIVLAGAASAQPAAQPSAEAVEHGRQLFMSNGCYTCHGIVGQGTWRDGPRINPPMPYEAMLQQLRTPRLEMPPYVASVAPDKTVADIHAYLASVPKPVDASLIKGMQ